MSSDAEFHRTIQVQKCQCRSLNMPEPCLIKLHGAGAAASYLIQTLHGLEPHIISINRTGKVCQRPDQGNGILVRPQSVVKLGSNVSSVYSPTRARDEEEEKSEI
jgi:hypothetical protein